MASLFKTVSLAPSSEPGVDEMLLETGRRNGVGWAWGSRVGAAWPSGQRRVAGEAGRREGQDVETLLSQPQRW